MHDNKSAAFGKILREESQRLALKVIASELLKTL
jgi:hypothetical protein